MIEAMLVLNVGSSSLKFALYGRSSLEIVCRGSLDAIGTDRTKLSVNGPHAGELAGVAPPQGDLANAVDWLLGVVAERLSGLRLNAAGHRVVHGGTAFADPVRIDADVLAKLETLVPLAPNHQPQNLAAIRAVMRKMPDLPQIACFDTAFHRTQPMHAQRFALPRELTDEGIVRYGFHGLSYDYLAGVLAEYAGGRADGRVVLAHLGHGASLCALRERRSIATTMGFTALDGLMMGTRSGSIDPGVVLYLIQQKRMTAERVADLLYNRSGLLGVSGISDDLRVLEADASEAATMAMDLFAYRTACEIGALTAALGGLDVLVFSAGIGEHSSTMRGRICAYLGWLGVALDAKANAANATRIGAATAAVDVLVIPTDEELAIARSVRRVLFSPAASDRRSE